MTKKPTNKLRALDPGLTRFVKDNVRDPAQALRDMRSIKNDEAPPREVVTQADLIAPTGGGRNLNASFNGEGVREVHGPSYTGPRDRRSYSRANSPAPAVSTSHPAQHPFTEAGSGQKIVFIPVGVGLPSGDPRD